MRTCSRPGTSVIHTTYLHTHVHTTSSVPIHLWMTCGRPAGAFLPPSTYNFGGSFVVLSELCCVVWQRRGRIGGSGSRGKENGWVLFASVQSSVSHPCRAHMWRRSHRHNLICGCTRVKPYSDTETFSQKPLCLKCQEVNDLSSRQKPGRPPLWP